MIELKQLQCFVAVATELHFSRAAEQLNMTQPPLSRQIALLEHAIGTTLLDRNSRNVRLTSAGRAFLKEAVQILKLADEAAANARHIALGKEGILNIGFTAVSGYYLLPQIVRKIKSELPNITLNLKEMVTHQQINSLNSGSIDIGIMRPSFNLENIEQFSLGDESLVLAYPSTWEAIASPVDISILNGQRLVMYSPYESQYFHNLVRSLFAKNNISPKIVEVVSQVHTMLALVSAGLGFAVIPDSARHLHFDGVDIHELVDNSLQVQTVTAIKTDNENPIVNVLKESIFHDG